MLRFEPAQERYRKRRLRADEAGELLGMSGRHFPPAAGALRRAGEEGLRDRRLGKPSPRRAPMAELSCMQILYQKRYRDFTVSEQQLGLGAFNLQNIPFGVGGGTTKLVIKTAFGEEQELSAPYYLSTQTLKEGLSQYQYEIGVLRPPFCTTSFTFGKPAFECYHLYGFTNLVHCRVSRRGRGIWVGRKRWPCVCHDHAARGTRRIRGVEPREGLWVCGGSHVLLPPQFREYGSRCRGPPISAVDSPKFKVANQTPARSDHH